MLRGNNLDVCYGPGGRCANSRQIFVEVFLASVHFAFLSHRYPHTQNLEERTMNMTIHSNAEEYNIRMFVRPVQSRN